MMAHDVEREFKDLSRHATIRDDPFVEDFNMTLAQPHAKSVRLNGLATCLRLENVYWNILSGIAHSNDCSVNAVLSYIDREVHLRYGGVKNFSGLIRVVCVAHLLKTDRQGIYQA
ncbi:ribbon-helix-helix domain-containing protein [Pseudomonas viridiflava]|uniref:ribbon-helix-helix domain-containing protein n=1 Tax=Pseudomonas viridiflava TaxID=33069 RepID=UPI0019822F59|nr:ribbon-helix-helix domain-containing protein [Pseudomonas viridiflava]QXG48931.1 ribbon-helix-helix domain-containing protein [Pseudomonas viridiflava]